MAAYPVALFQQLDLQAARAVAAFVVVKNRYHLRFPSGLLLPHGPRRLRQPLSVVAAGYDPET